jgi:protein-S-isoprenylcysteine O-methyltransferase Ste14
MWTIRCILLLILFVQVYAFGYLIGRRRNFKNLLENGPLNLLMVISYNLLCYLLAGLPSDPRVFSRPAFFANPIVRIGYPVAGILLIVASASVWWIAVRQRRTLGGQKVKAGLLTSGIYRYARHPIYASIVGASLGLALTLKTWDGLLMIPAILLVNLLEASFEERSDIGARYPAEYVEFKKRTRMFGPIWFWATLAGILLAIAAIAWS